MHRVMIGEKLRILRKNLALRGILDVFFQLHHALFASHHEQLIEHLEGLQVMILAVRAAFEHRDQPLYDPDYRGKRVGDQERPRASAANNDQLRGLDQYADLAVFHKVAAHHGPQNDDDSNECEHQKPYRLPTQGYVRCATLFSVGCLWRWNIAICTRLQLWLR